MRSQVDIAASGGFCLGVRRAVEGVERLARQPRQGRLVTLGPLIHNDAEVARLRALGVLPVDEAGLQRGDEVVVRTHGATPAELQTLSRLAASVHDLTCPYVRSLQALVRRLAQARYGIVLVGDREHPEVRAVLACAREGCPDPGAVLAVASAAELDGVPGSGGRPGPSKIAVLAQTTQSPDTLRDVASAILARLGLPRGSSRGGGGGLVELRVFDTICRATRDRQAEARDLAARTELMLVVGDRQSANTRRLLESCRAVQPRAELIAGAEQIDRRWLRGVRRIAVTGGASTPLATLHEIAAWLRDLEHE